VEGAPTAAPVEGAELFRALARAQIPRLYCIAWALAGHDAEDAVQDCLLKAFQRFGQLTEVAAGPVRLTSVLIDCRRNRGRAKARGSVEVDIHEIKRFSFYRTTPFGALHLELLCASPPSVPYDQPGRFFADSLMSRAPTSVPRPDEMATL